MRVVSFNIQHGRTREGQVDSALTARTCGQWAPDVLGLQEVDRGVDRSGNVDQAAVVASETGLTAAFGPALRLDGGEYGNALLVRGAVADVEVIQLPGGAGAAGRGRAGREPRTLLVARAELETGSISVGVTHLSTHGPHAIGQLLAVVEALRRRPPPRLLLGDFNLRPDAVRPVLDRGRMSVSAPVLTFPSWRPDRTIDYVAASGLEVVETRAEAADVSDHCALVTDVQ